MVDNAPAKSGTGGATGFPPGTDLSMGGHKLTGVGDAAAATDVLNRESGDARYDAAGAAAAEATRALAAEALLAPLASPALTGTPTAPTATPLDASTKLASTAYADTAVAVEKARALAAESAPGIVNATSGLANQVPFANGAGGYAWGSLPSLQLLSYVLATDLAAGTTLSSPLGTGSPTTSLTVPALTDSLPAGYVIALDDGVGGHTDTVTVASAGAAQGATSIPVVSKTVNFAYPATSTHVRWLDYGPAIYRADQAARKSGGIIDYPALPLWVGTTTGSDLAKLTALGISIGSSYSAYVIHRGRGWGTTTVYLTSLVNWFCSAGGGASSQFKFFAAVDFTIDFNNVQGAGLAGGIIDANVGQLNLHHMKFDLQAVNAGTSNTGSQISMFDILCDLNKGQAGSTINFKEIPNGWYRVSDITIRGEYGMAAGGGLNCVFIGAFTNSDSLSITTRYQGAPITTSPVAACFLDFIDVDCKWDGNPNGFPTSFGGAVGFQIGADGVTQSCSVKGWFKGAADDNEIDSASDATVDAVVVDCFNSNFGYFHAKGTTPMIVGSGGIQFGLTAALTSGVAPTALSVTPLPCILTPGTTVKVTSGTHGQTFTVGGTAMLLPGATSIPLSAAPNANFSFPPGSLISNTSPTAVTDGPGSRMKLRLKSYRLNDTGGTDPQHICLNTSKNGILPDVVFDDCQLVSYVKGASPLQIYGRIRKIEGSVKIDDRFFLQATGNGQVVTYSAANITLTGMRTDMASFRVHHEFLPTIDPAGNTGYSVTATGVSFGQVTDGDLDLDFSHNASATVVDSVGGGTVTPPKYQQTSLLNQSADAVTDNWAPGNSYTASTVFGAGQQPNVTGNLTLVKTDAYPPAGTITVPGSTAVVSYTGNNVSAQTLTGCYGGDPGFTATNGLAVTVVSGDIPVMYLNDNGLITTPAASMGGNDAITLIAGNKLQPAPGADSGVSEAAKEFRFLQAHGVPGQFFGAIGPQSDDARTLVATPDAGVASHIGYVVLKWLDGQAIGSATPSMLIVRVNGTNGLLEIVTVNAGTITVRATAALGTALVSGTSYAVRGWIQGNVVTAQYWAATSSNPAFPGTPTATVSWTLTGSGAGSDVSVLGDGSTLGYGGFGGVPGGPGAVFNSITWTPLSIIHGRMRLKAHRTSGFTSANIGVLFGADLNTSRVLGRLHLRDCAWRGLSGGGSTPAEVSFASSKSTNNALQQFVEVTDSAWYTPPVAATASLNSSGNVIQNQNHYPVMCYLYGFTLTTPFLKKVPIANDVGVRPAWTGPAATLPGQGSAVTIVGAADSGAIGGILLRPGEGIQPTYSAGGTATFDPAI